VLRTTMEPGDVVDDPGQCLPQIFRTSRGAEQGYPEELVVPVRADLVEGASVGCDDVHDPIRREQGGEPLVDLKRATDVFDDIVQGDHIPGLPFGQRTRVVDVTRD